MYEIKIYVYGKVVLTTRYDDSEFEKMKDDYIRNSKNIDQYTQLVINGKPLKMFEAEEFLCIDYSDKKRAWSKGEWW